jgi:hypothetical protein
MSGRRFVANKRLPTILQYSCWSTSGACISFLNTWPRFMGMRRGEHSMPNFCSSFSMLWCICIQVPDSSNANLIPRYNFGLPSAVISIWTLSWSSCGQSPLYRHQLKVDHQHTIAKLYICHQLWNNKGYSLLCSSTYLFLANDHQSESTIFSVFVWGHTRHLQVNRPF